MITIIDYGLGNLGSVANVLSKLSIPYQISAEIEAIQQASVLILPGVGAAGEGMKNLKRKGLDKLILEQVKKGTPILGICLGMQLLLSASDEGNVACLNLVKGRVKKFVTNLKVPQIGWNEVQAKPKSKLLNGLNKNTYFYFVNSYYCDLENKDVITGVTSYGQDFCSVLEIKNIYGVQFHPEKSGKMGLKLIKNFCEEVC